MDHLDHAKEQIVNAMGALEDALVDGLPAQAPGSDIDQVRDGITLFKKRIYEAQAYGAKAEVALERATLNDS